jgi:hypothetical protein
LKIDVEGAELLVLEGARTTLESARPAVFCEMLRKHSSAFSTTPNDTISMMADVGYACIAISAEHSNLRLIEQVDVSTIETNFLYLHRDRHVAELDQLGV